MNTTTSQKTSPLYSHTRRHYILTRGTRCNCLEMLEKRERDYTDSSAFIALYGLA